MADNISMIKGLARDVSEGNYDKIPLLSEFLKRERIYSRKAIVNLAQKGERKYLSTLGHKRKEAAQIIGEQPEHVIGFIEDLAEHYSDVLGVGVRRYLQDINHFPIGDMCIPNRTKKPFVGVHLGRVPSVMAFEGETLYCYADAVIAPEANTILMYADEFNMNRCKAYANLVDGFKVDEVHGPQDCKDFPMMSAESVFGKIIDAIDTIKVD